jgi:AcrR family transcriptional regulator
VTTAADSGPVVRRAPFSDNPTVGPRGQRTQQRILDAALLVLRDEGYHRCSVDRITRLAGCSRVSFYQYFSGKEDVFYRLAGVVAAQVRASLEALDPLTPDAHGREAVRSWVARQAGIYHRYGPVFNAFGAAAAGTEAVAALGSHAGEQNIVLIRSRLAAITPAPRELDAVITLLLGCLARTFQLAGVLRAAAPDGYPILRMEGALADVFHRTLFGRLDGVNTAEATGDRPPHLAFSPSTAEILARGGVGRERADASRPTVETLLAAGRDVFVNRGYAGARVDDIVEAAGVSHGTFYQYFKNKNDLAHVLVLEAMRPLATAFVGMPVVSSDAAALRRWLRVYNASHVHEAALIRVWVDAQAQDSTLGADAAPAIDWGRRRVAGFLRPRGFGDVEAEAVVMVALLDAFGSHVRSGRVIDAVALIVQRGLLGL